MNELNIIWRIQNPVFIAVDKFETNLRAQWTSAFKQKKFRIHFLVSVGMLVLCGMVAPHVFGFIESRSGQVLRDFILESLPSYNLSFWIFLILYVLIAACIGYLLYHPHRFLFAMQAYVMLIVFRFTTMLLFPLDPPAGLIILQDPFVDRLFYQQPVTKDLFFSGHASILCLFAIVIQQPVFRRSLVIGILSVSLLILFQHAHYTIDLIAAPFFAWLACRSARSLKTLLWGRTTD